MRGTDGIAATTELRRSAPETRVLIVTTFGVVDPALATDSLVAGESPLTARETEVLRAARDGSSVAVIARKLFLSEGTVRNHLSSRSARPARPTGPRQSSPPRATAGSED